MKLQFLLILLIPVAANFYVLWHIWQILPVSHLWKWVAVGVFTFVFAAFFLALSRRLDMMPFWLGQGVYEVGTSWVIILLYLFMFFLLADVCRLLHIIPATLLKNSLTGTLITAGVMLLLFGYGSFRYHQKERQEIHLTTSRPNARNMRIAMLSDLHLGYHNRRKELERWVRIINDEHPDFVVLAGDVIDRSLRPLLVDNDAEAFRKIKAPIYACFGNHEFYAGVQGSADFYRQAGINLLRDSVVNLDGISFVGRDDRSNPHRHSLKELMQHCDRNNYSVVLDHQPYLLDEAQRCGADLQLSGHTHHGQVWPANLITEKVYECAYGAYRRGDTDYYVSSGIGIWGGKFRIGTRSEYVVIDLRRQ